MPPEKVELMLREQDELPDIDVDRDILPQMEFKPGIAEDLHEMDPRIFKDEKMDLKKRCL